MSEPQDLTAFYRDEQAGEFNVQVRITGTAYLTVKATDVAEAKRQVEAMLENNEVELYGDAFNDVDICYVRASPTMYLVMRDGKEMGVSHVQPGDQPCLPSSEYMASKYLPPANSTPIRLEKP